MYILESMASTNTNNHLRLSFWLQCINDKSSVVRHCVQTGLGVVYWSEILKEHTVLCTNWAYKLYTYGWHDTFQKFPAPLLPARIRNECPGVRRDWKSTTIYSYLGTSVAMDCHAVEVVWVTVVYPRREPAKTSLQNKSKTIILWSDLCLV
jgi:hypothetical protein